MRTRSTHVDRFNVSRKEIWVNCFRVNNRADGCIASLSTGNHVDSIPPPLRTGLITASSLNNSTDLLSANEFVDSLLHEMIFALSVTPALLRVPARSFLKRIYPLGHTKCERILLLSHVSEAKQISILLECSSA